MVSQLINILRGARPMVLTLLYVVVATASLLLAYEVRFDFAIPPEVHGEMLRVLWLLLPVKLLALLLARQMGSMITFFSIPDFIRLSMALLIAAVLLIIPRFTGYGQFSPPRGVLLVDFLVCL